ncbi:ATP-binding cassette domain-containing protein [candidate division KSB1 bacterium]|nr:ATP-binding cassette domain-containing protein [candidate division KSB1 bacterium]
MIELCNVWYILEKHPILEDITIHIKPGEMVYLFGPSGAGKSTLLRLAHMEIMPTRGMVRVADFNSSRITKDEIPFLRRKVGVVFQDFKLLPDRDVFDNVSFALWATGVPYRKIKKRVLQVLAEVGLSHKRYAMIKTLSGGEQQRVCMARALANEPFILLADEPTGNLDDESSRDILTLLGRINRRGTAILMATHKEDAIHQIPGRILRLKEGKLMS